MRAWVIKRGNQYAQDEYGGRYGKLNKAMLFPKKRLASVDAYEDEKVIPVEITLIKGKK